jgi:branched-chain amino acid transport system permease protein
MGQPSTARSQTRSNTFRFSRARALDAGLIVLFLVMVALLLVQVPAHGLNFFLAVTVTGVSDGALFALLAIGYTMVFGIIELINFAHGDLLTLGGFVSLTFVSLFGLTSSTTVVWLVPALLIVMFLTMVILGVVNVAIERVVFRPLRQRSRLAPLIGAVGVSFLLEGIMYLWHGPFSVNFPNLLPIDQLTIFGSKFVGIKDIVVILVTLVLVVALGIFISRFQLGRAMRATAQDREGALLMGVNTDNTIAATFFVGAALAGAGGMMYGLYLNNLVFNLGYANGLIAFTGAVIGGIGNIPGAALGGLIIGLISTYSDSYFASIWTHVWLFSILIVFLIFRPTGLLGRRAPDR